jgi:hypothetical protein
MVEATARMLVHGVGGAHDPAADLAQLAGLDLGQWVEH